MKKLTKKKLFFIISGGISFLLFLILYLVSGHMIASLAEQNMAKRWSKEGGVAQISCFFSSNARMSEGTIEEFEHSLDSFLNESSITLETENPGARLWVDAYSADGKISLSGAKASVEADAVGIGGDFFLFHPQKLLSGSYFSGNDVNHDYCVIDQDAAWQLFGSNDVAGKMVTIAGIPHIITGVIERPSGKMLKAAGLDGTRVYVSLQTLTAYGRTDGINHYEIVMPNPVSKFALKHLQERMGADEKETEVLENTTRFSLLNRLKLIKTFGTRSMNGKAIIYPYWENLARGYEDIIGAMTFFAMLFLVYPLVLLIIWLIVWWKHKGWTFKSVYLKIKDKIERFGEKCYAKRRKKHEKVEKGGESLSGVDDDAKP